MKLLRWLPLATLGALWVCVLVSSPLQHCNSLATTHCLLQPLGSQLSSTITHGHQRFNIVLIETLLDAFKHPMRCCDGTLPSSCPSCSRLSSTTFVVRRMVLKKASTSPLFPGFPVSAMRNFLYSATACCSAPSLNDSVRLPSLQL